MLVQQISWSIKLLQIHVVILYYVDMITFLSLIYVTPKKQIINYSLENIIKETKMDFNSVILVLS